MYKYIFLLCSFLLGNLFVVEINGVQYYENDFYSFYSQDAWEAIGDTEKRKKVLDDFIIKKGVFLDAIDNNVQNDPLIIERLTQREGMLLVNEYYFNFFLKTLVPDYILLNSKKNLSKKIYVKHILIGYDGVNLIDKNLPIKDEAWGLVNSIKDSLIWSGGSMFEVLAKRHSHDPSVNKNNGSLGWVDWGRMLPPFQDVAFSLNVGEVGIANTEYGYHVILVDSVSVSTYSNLQQNEYNDLAFRFATAYIKDSLAYKAQQHDSLLFNQAEIVFNLDVITGFYNTCNSLLSKGKSRRQIDVISILNNYPGVFAIYNDDVLGGAWFGNKLSLGTRKKPFYNSTDEIIQSFSTLLIQDLAVGLSRELGLNGSFSYLKQYNGVLESILYKAQINILIQNCINPTEDEVVQYYNKYKGEKYINSKDEKNISFEVAQPGIESLLLKKKQDEVQENYLNSFLIKNTNINYDWLNNVK